MMTTIKDLIKEIETLRNGSSVDELSVDIIEILNNLSEYEIDSYFDIDIDFDNIDSTDELLFELENIGYIGDYTKADNSYNWGANISNDFDYRVYDNLIDGGYIVEFKVHRFGDVRCNYTDSILLSFSDLYILYELISECNKYIDIVVDDKMYDITVSALCDTYEVYDADGNYICEAYGDMEDIKEIIKEKVVEA